MPLNSYYERNEVYEGKEVLIKEMKYMKNDIIIHIHIIVRKEEMIVSIQKPERVNPWELINPYIKQIQKGDRNMSYKVDDRVVVNMGSKKKPHYFLADVIKVKGDKVKIEFDNDDKDPEIIEEDFVIGYGIKKRFKKEINPEFLDDYLEEEEVKPAKKKKSSDDEEEEVKPKKKKVDDDEEEEVKPKKKKVDDDEEEEVKPTKKPPIEGNMESALCAALEEIQNILDKDLSKMVEKMGLISELLTELLPKKKSDSTKKASKEVEEVEDDTEEEEEVKPSKKSKPVDEDEIEEDDNWLDED